MVELIIHFRMVFGPQTAHFPSPSPIFPSDTSRRSLIWVRGLDWWFSYWRVGCLGRRRRRPEAEDGVFAVQRWLLIVAVDTVVELGTAVAVKPASAVAGAVTVSLQTVSLFAFWLQQQEQESKGSNIQTQR